MLSKIIFGVGLCALLLSIVSCATTDKTMTSESKVEYKTTVEDAHWRNEDLQWARIFSEGNPAKAMVVLYINKECAAFHELEPAWRQGALKAEHLDFFRKRLVRRIRHVLVTMQNNDLDTINGAAELAEIVRSIESAKTMDELAALTEKVHTINHLLYDSLEKL